jgi:hypothetical protein
MNDEMERKITEIILQEYITNCMEKMPAAAAHKIRLLIEQQLELLNLK